MNIWSYIENQLIGGNSVMLITVTNRKGSSPGIVGFKMAVSQDGTHAGSIGGGAMEYNMVELAKKELSNPTPKAFLKHQVHRPDAGAEKSGLICAGEQDHAFVYINTSDLELIRQIAECYAAYKPGVLQINNKGLEFDRNKEIKKRIEYSYTDHNQWEYNETIGIRPTLYIFGGGHVSLSLSQIFKILEFRVKVFDNRENLSTFTANTYAHKKSIVDYAQISHLVPDGENSFAVIMTVSHQSDALVLKQLVTKNIKYLGMIGSKKKIKTIFDKLRAAGITDEELKKVDAPIGLPIKSETTQEIAISIAAKIIQIKNT